MFGHGPTYWKKDGRKEKEIFANLFSLECMKDDHKLAFLKKEFPSLMEAYENLDFSVQLAWLEEYARNARIVH